MNTTSLSSKGQVVIPKALRERLRIRSGQRFEISERDGDVVLRPVKTKSVSIADWKPINPAGIHLTIEELCAPVDLRIKPPKRLQKKAATKVRSDRAR